MMDKMEFLGIKQKQLDSDGDYWGDNQDWDDDNDGMEDSRENSLGIRF